MSPPPDVATGWQPLLDALPQAAWIVGLHDLRVVAVNAAACELLALPSERLLGARATAVLATPEDLAYWHDAAPGGAQRLLSDTVFCRADGATIHAVRSIAPLAEGHCVVTLLDRRRQQQAEDDREERLTELQATLEATADGILVTDLDGRVRACNRRYAQMWAVPDELLARHDEAALDRWMRNRVSDPDAYDRRLQSLQQTPLLATAERLMLADGRVLERVTRPLCSRGRAHGRVHSFRDLTERLADSRRIQALTLTDGLTGLPNRRQLAQRVAEAARLLHQEGTHFALLLVDLDRFRQVNASLGHDSGDRVLFDVAQRIRRCMRGHDLLARVGGDQFALVVHGADAAAAEAAARRVLKVVAQPSDAGGVPFTLTCSIGVALSPPHGLSVDELVRHAEAAMRAVKAQGRASYRFHQPRAETDPGSHIRFDHAMRQGLAGGRFRLHYQPQLRLADGALVGAEALLRWHDPELGHVSPARFIPVAEESGFVVTIGDWVLSQAVRQAALWHASGRPLPVAINVSALQFQQADFVDRVAGVLAVSGLPPALLELELTESILLRDADEALARLHALARLGVKLSIDDFGTGYSSLAYLKRIPIGKLKIDRSFVMGLPADGGDGAIVVAILQMARALGMRSLAEGVETETQRDFLRDRGCDEFQGFLHAPALDVAAFERHLPPPRQPVR